MSVRPAVVAGTFYPRDPERLRADVNALLARAPRNGRAPKALIAPHAGYVYSGAVAATAFGLLRDRAVTRVVVIGPAHYVALRGIAVPTVAAFATPLGAVPVDRDALAAIAGLPFVRRDDAPHATEHSLEVELPFLQVLLPSASIVPLLVGDAAPREVGEALRLLWGGRETLILVSSDLSHYHDYDTARRLDNETAAAIERADWNSLGPSSACGCLPIAGLLTEVARRGLAIGRLALCNSGDTAGPRDRVVGYGAWLIAEPTA